MSNCTQPKCHNKLGPYTKDWKQIELDGDGRLPFKTSEYFFWVVCVQQLVYDTHAPSFDQGSVWGWVALTLQSPCDQPYMVVCAQERAYVGESVNEFDSLLVSFKDPWEPQRKKWLLQCRFDPFQLLIDVEWWLQRGPQQPVRLREGDGHWRLLKTSKHTTHALLYLVRLPWFLGNVVGQVEAHLW